MQNLSKLEPEGNLLILKKGIWEKPTANIVLNGERLSNSLSVQEQDKDVQPISIQHCCRHPIQHIKT